MMSDRDALKRLVFVRSVALALPEVSERLSHGSPTFFAGKKTFVMFTNDHHSDGRVALWVAGTLDEQQALIAENPNAYFRPPYVGGRGWIGVRLDRDLPDDEIAELIDSAYRIVATRKLLAQLDSSR
jgi:hypothetical protein